MPPTHRKLRRKDLKEPDEFLSFFQELQEFVTTNLTRIIISAAVVAGAAIAVISVYYYERNRDQLASAQFRRAFQALDAKQYKSAEQTFSELSAAEPGRELGRLSRFYLASCYLGENDLPRARDALVAYLSEAHDQEFEALALMDLGIVYEKMGDLKKAEGAYRQAAASPGTHGPRPELGVARILARTGDRAGAIGAYRGFLGAHPFGVERQDVIEALAQLGASAQPDTRGASGQGTASKPPMP